MFIDEVIFEVVGGDGGNGCCAFRREKYVPMGGPFGGSGGRGSDIIFKADEGLKTLIDLRYMHHIKGKRGENGSGKSKSGAAAENITIKVPVGTVVKDNDNGLILADLTKNDEEVVIATGGRGGRGNVSLATRANPCPEICENGEPGELRNIKCELKLMADVGLVGMPSVGKSTLLSVISNANPKIGAYHFTTLSPNLGVVTTRDKKQFVVADLPGLIEGASDGLGLGIRFLKHIERTKLIAHIIDMGAEEGRDPVEDFEIINKELHSYSEKLANKDQVVIANKMDVAGAIDNLEKFKEKYKDIMVYEISAINNIGIDEMITGISDKLDTIENVKLYDEEIFESHILYKFKREKPFVINRDNNIWVIRGDQVEKLLKMTKFSSEEAFVRFAKKLRGMGIDDKLEELGAKEGDIVRILDFEFEYRK